MPEAPQFTQFQSPYYEDLQKNMYEKIRKYLNLPYSPSNAGGAGGQSWGGQSWGGTPEEVYSGIQPQGAGGQSWGETPEEAIEKYKASGGFTMPGFSTDPDVIARENAAHPGMVRIPNTSTWVHYGTQPPGAGGQLVGSEGQMPGTSGQFGDTMGPQSTGGEGYDYDSWVKRFTPETSQFFPQAQAGFQNLLNTQSYNTPSYMESIEKPYLDTLLKEYKTSRGEGFKPVQEGLIAENLYGSGPGFQRMQEYGEKTAEGVGDITKQWAYEGIERRTNQDRYYDALKRGDIETAYNIALMEEERNLQPKLQATQAEAGSMEMGMNFMRDISDREAKLYNASMVPYQADLQKYLQDKSEKMDLIGTGAGIIGDVGGSLLKDWLSKKLIGGGAATAIEAGIGVGAGMGAGMGAGIGGGAGMGAGASAAKLGIQAATDAVGAETAAALPATFLSEIGRMVSTMAPPLAALYVAYRIVDYFKKKREEDKAPTRQNVVSDMTFPGVVENGEVQPYVNEFIEKTHNVDLNETSSDTILPDNVVYDAGSMATMTRVFSWLIQGNPSADPDTAPGMGFIERLNNERRAYPNISAEEFAKSQGEELGRGYLARTPTGISVETLKYIFKDPQKFYESYIEERPENASMPKTAFINLLEGIKSGLNDSGISPYHKSFSDIPTNRSVWV